MLKKVKSERKLLLQSVYAALFVSLLGVFIGIISSSQMILFDGFYSLISVALSLLSVIAVRFMNKQDYKKYPFGKTVVEPLVIIVKYTIITILLFISSVTSIMTILNGGRNIELGIALGYSVFSTLLCLIVYLQFKKHGNKNTSSLLISEANQWLMDTWVSLGVMISFSIVCILDYFSLFTSYLPYVDPLVVILICIYFIKIPYVEIKLALKEVLDVSPEDEFCEKLEGIITEIEKEYNIEESILRVTRVTRGRKKLWLEVDFVISDKSKIKTIKDQDLVREKLAKKFSNMAAEQWISISFTGDRKWAI